MRVPPMMGLLRLPGWLAAVFLLTMLAVPLMTSCGSSEYMIFSLREGIGHFSMEYPPAYSVTRIDIRNEASTKYTDVGLRADPAPGTAGLNEISVYAWTAGLEDRSAALILENMLGRAGAVFTDFKILEKYSTMIGDLDGQAAVFSWTATDNTTDTAPLPAVSNMVCFRHSDIAWELHVASDTANQALAKATFEHIVETFQVLN